MTEFAFYGCSLPLDRVVPKLVEKAYSARLRVQLVFDCQERLDHFDTILWTFAQSAFLPHGKVGKASDHPVWLSLDIINTNKADVVVLVGYLQKVNDSSYGKVIYTYEKTDETDQLVHSLCEFYKGSKLTIWNQTIQGQWTEQERPVDLAS